MSSLTMSQKSKSQAIQMYIDCFSEKEILGYAIAKSHLGHSFQIDKSVGFEKWKKENPDVIVSIKKSPSSDLLLRALGAASMKKSPSSEKLLQLRGGGSSGSVAGGGSNLCLKKSPSVEHSLCSKV
jgi:hypothetical protein